MQANATSLLRELQTLEVELHRTSTRSDIARLDALLHDNFQEFGRSGNTYRKADVVARLPTETQHPQIVADRFEVRILAEGIALLTYRSVTKFPDGTFDRFTLRSSIWQHSARGWQMSFHQGTPTEPYKPEHLASPGV
jgi:hypothetical protein